MRVIVLIVVIVAIFSFVDKANGEPIKDKGLTWILK